MKPVKPKAIVMKAYTQTSQMNAAGRSTKWTVPKVL